MDSPYPPGAPENGDMTLAKDEKVPDQLSVCFWVYVEWLRYKDEITDDEDTNDDIADCRYNDEITLFNIIKDKKGFAYVSISVGKKGQ